MLGPAMQHEMAVSLDIIVALSKWLGTVDETVPCQGRKKLPWLGNPAWNVRLHAVYSQHCYAYYLYTFAIQHIIG